MASALIGTIGALGSSILGDLAKKGISALGDIASNKIEGFKKQQTGRTLNRGQFNQLNSQIQKNTQQISSLGKRVNNIEEKMQIEY